MYSPYSLSLSSNNNDLTKYVHSWGWGWVGKEMEKESRLVKETTDTIHCQSTTIVYHLVLVSGGETDDDDKEKHENHLVSIDSSDAAAVRFLKKLLPVI